MMMMMFNQRKLKRQPKMMTSMREMISHPKMMLKNHRVQIPRKRMSAIERTVPH